MKLTGLILALLVLAGAVSPLPGQTTEADRRKFDSVKAQADEGDAEAQVAVAALYARGIGVSRDQAKAVKYLRKAAEQGHARAQCLLALDYANGDGVKKVDKIEAARWFKRAAEQGLPEAQYDLGMCYANGDGVERSDVEAVTWYRKAAEQGLADAQWTMGNCYLEGTGVPKDIPEGVKWIQIAAERGFAPAQGVLGRCYTKGRGVPKDYVQAYKWFNLAAAKGGQLGDDMRIELAMTERFLTPEQIAEGQRLAREFKPRDISAPQKAATSQRPATTPTNAPLDWSSAPARAATGTFVNVTAADPDCEIFVDGGFVGNTPARVKVAPGAHVVEVKKAGYKDYRRQLQMNEGSELTLRAVLEKQ